MLRSRVAICASLLFLRSHMRHCFLPVVRCLTLFVPPLSLPLCTGRRSVCCEQRGPAVLLAAGPRTRHHQQRMHSCLVAPFLAASLLPQEKVALVAWLRSPSLLPERLLLIEDVSFFTDLRAIIEFRAPCSLSSFTWTPTRRWCPSRCPSSAPWLRKHQCLLSLGCCDIPCRDLLLQYEVIRLRCEVAAP